MRNLPKVQSITFGLLLPLFASSAFAYQCDCTQVEASCAGHINVKPTTSSTGLHGAELAITANAAECAKVEYYIDNRPAFTILPNGKSGSDQIMAISDKPFDSQRVMYESCKVCKSNGTDDERAQTEAKLKAAQELEEAKAKYEAEYQAEKARREGGYSNYSSNDSEPTERYSSSSSSYESSSDDSDSYQSQSSGPSVMDQLNQITQTITNIQQQSQSALYQTQQNNGGDVSQQQNCRGCGLR